MNQNNEEIPFVYIYSWGNTLFRATLKGRKCKIIKKGSEDMVVLEFDDGQQVTSSKWAIKRAPED